MPKEGMEIPSLSKAGMVGPCRPGEEAAVLGEVGDGERGRDAAPVTYLVPTTPTACPCEVFTV